MRTLVQPNDWVFLRLPSDSLKVQQVIPNTVISLGKYGSFPANLILSRPYNLTYELRDRLPSQKDSGLRIVPASELHADTIAEENAASNPGDSNTIGGDGVEFQLVGEDGSVLMRSNRETIDDSARQTLTMEEIEDLKRDGTGAGKDLIAKLMASHLGIEQKTAFSLAKYKLLKTKKYLRRFTILEMDVPMLTRWMMEEKDASKVLELREEMLALIGSWSNVHFSQHPIPETTSGRWLCVDETGGLLVAALAERMGILHPNSSSPSPEEEEKHTSPTLAISNTITLVHNNAQPNLTLLQYFLYSPTSLTTSPSHPLSTNLHSLSWLQLLDPSEDSTFSMPIPSLTPEELAAMKSNKRGTYHRKHRRYTRVHSIVSSTLSGGFDGLAVASHIDPLSVLKPLIPLLRGGAPVVVYTPTIESLTVLADIFSTSRRTAFIQAPPADFLSFVAPDPITGGKDNDPAAWPGNEDFPLNPTILLNTSVQSARVREWQVLPGRTHPLMTGRGGAEGYLFTAVKVVPAETGRKVVARGKFGKRRVEKGEEKDAKKAKVEAEGGEMDMEGLKAQIGGEELGEPRLKVVDEM